MENTIIQCKDSTLRLSSGLTPQGFAKTYITHAEKENGFLFTIKKDEISWENWTFDETKDSDSGKVEYIGNFHSSRTLLEILTSDSQDKILFVKAYLKVLDFALEQKIEMKAIGAAGIVCAGNDDETKILFLPAEIFEQSALNTSKEMYSQLQGKFLRKGLTGENALMFTRGAISYMALTGEYPFNEDDTFKRQADIIDSNFIPLELMVNGIDSDVAQQVNFSLKIEVEFEPAPGEKRFQNKNDLKRQEAIKSQARNFDSTKVLQEMHKIETKEMQSTMSNLDFVSARKSYLNSKKRSVKFNRFTRRYKNYIKVFIVVLCVALYAGKSFYDTKMSRATSIGLTSKETVQLIFSAIHNENDMVIKQVSEGENMEAMDNMVSQIYVSIKQRETLNQDAKSIKPAQWLFFTEGSTFWQYGITNLKIDGEDYSLNMEMPTNGNHKHPITFEENNGKKLNLSKGTIVNHKVEYNFIYHEGVTLKVNHEVVTMELTFDGKKWIATNITQESISHDQVKHKDYVADYNEALNRTNRSVKDAVALMRNKYFWIPRDDEMLEAAHFMVEEYNSSAAKAFIQQK